MFTVALKLGVPKVMPVFKKASRKPVGNNRTSMTGIHTSQLSGKYRGEEN